MPREQYLIMVGNPGVGKSTLLSSLCDEAIFKSGVSIGSGLTTVLQKTKVGETTYVDTPGLDDIDRRDRAAAEIKQALQQDGVYKVVFVAKLDMGRIRDVDVSTMKLVLDALPDDVEHSLVLNILEGGEFEKLREHDGEELNKLLKMINKGLGEQHTTRLDNVFLMPRQDDLAGKCNKVMDLPADHAFRLFLACAPEYDIMPPTVAEIRHERFEEEAARLRKEREDLQQQLDAQTSSCGGKKKGIDLLSFVRRAGHAVLDTSIQFGGEVAGSLIAKKFHIGEPSGGLGKGGVGVAMKNVQKLVNKPKPKP